MLSCVLSPFVVPMYFGCWNIRGLNDPMKQREARKLIKEHHLSLFGIVETKVKAINKDSILRSIARDWGVLCNYSHSPSGRIWVCWNPSVVSVTSIGQSDQVIHCAVQEVPNSWHCLVSIVYGDNCPARRDALWADLSSFAMTTQGLPWLVAGDFNAIRRRNERVGGSLEWPNWMNSLEECVIQAELFDLRFGGKFFTWSNRRDEGPILRKIDRVLVNADWEGVFSGSEAQFLPSGVSDHSPMIIKLSSLPQRAVV